MNISVLHIWGACSSLMFRSFNHKYGGGYEKEFFLDVAGSIPATLTHMGKKFNPEDFATIVCSALAPGGYDSSWFNEVLELDEHRLKRLGFRKTHRKPRYNSKNNTYVFLWQADVKVFLKNAKKIAKSYNWVDPRKKV